MSQSIALYIRYHNCVMASRAPGASMDQGRQAGSPKSAGKAQSRLVI